MPRCSQLTRRGDPCRNPALAGSSRCWSHRVVVDEQAVAQLAALLRAGNYPAVAALATGVPLDALPNDALAEIGRARAEGEARGIATIANAAGENWQAAAWLLERQYPERWGRPAVRSAEEPPPAPPVSDSLDELARRRGVRRAGG